jgi:hypothetical protein
MSELEARYCGLGGLGARRREYEEFFSKKISVLQNYNTWTNN